MTYTEPIPAKAEELEAGKTFALFSAFINQRPGLDPRDYDRSGYASDSRRVAKQKKEALAALKQAENFPFDAQAMIEATRAFSGRLSLVQRSKGLSIDYCTGQYWPTEYRAAAVLTAYVNAVRPKELPKPTDEFYDIRSLEIANERAGRFWFSRDNKKFARSRVLPQLYKGRHLIWFVSSEAKGFDNSARAFSVRVFDPKDADVNTAGLGFLAYSEAGAKSAARELAKRDLAGEHKQPLKQSDRCEFCGSYRQYCSGTPTEEVQTEG